jgi:hypothetical protein
MQEFSSISVSSYEAGSLAERLTEQSRDGWHVIAIVPTGSTVTAYLGRESDAGATPPMATATTSDAAGDTEPDATPGDASAEPFVVAAAIAPEPASDAPSELGAETDGAAGDDSAPAETVADVAPEAADAETTDTATDTTTDTTSDAASAGGAAPAGWYADPSGRFELRYWDGSQWTEHVSRAGQQYTDPPVA